MISLIPFVLHPEAFFRGLREVECSLRLDSIAESKFEASCSKPSYETPKNFSRLYMGRLTHSEDTARSAGRHNLDGLLDSSLEHEGRLVPTAKRKSDTYRKVGGFRVGSFPNYIDVPLPHQRLTLPPCHKRA